MPLNDLPEFIVGRKLILLIFRAYLLFLEFVHAHTDFCHVRKLRSRRAFCGLPFGRPRLMFDTFKRRPFLQRGSPFPTSVAAVV